MGQPPDTPEHHPSIDPEASQTDWSMIFSAAHGDSEPARQAWDRLARRYWPAIYAYARSRGQDVHGAADVTQGFVCEVMLGRGLVEHADPERGRFRTLLLTALRNYMNERHRRANRHIRAPRGGRQIVPLDESQMQDVASASYPSPEAAFSAQWSTALVRRVLDRVRAECLTEELSAHWAVFDARVARPMLTGGEPTPYASLVDTLDLKDAAQAANMMITVKRRFARTLHAEVGETVGDPGEIDDELRTLLAELERYGVGAG